MLKKFLSALTAGLLIISIFPLAGFAVERYEVLQIGDEDAWVMELQEKLNELGYLQVPATGYYGTNTQNAVINYQRDHGLTADGKAGPVTRQSILGDAYEPITGPRDDKDQVSMVVPPNSDSSSVSGTLSGGESDSASDPELPTGPEAEGPEPSEEPEQPDDSLDSGVESEEPAPDPDPEEPDAEEPEEPGDDGDGEEPAEEGDSTGSDVLQLGDKGDAISALQEKLKELEYYDYGAITGYYGPVTEEAVKKFERTHGLEEDGIMSPEDLVLLNSEDVQYYSMYPGDQGDDILEMQERLIELGYLEPDATGYYGTATTLAVKQFQENNDIVADGTAGKETRAILFSDKAVASDGVKPDSSASDGSDPEAIPGTGVTKLINVAESQTGKKYSYGSSGPNAYDCSGLVYYALKGAGVSIGRMSSAGYASVSAWETIKSKDDLKMGDLVFFKSDSSSAISHVGIYVGGGDFIHSAPSIGGVGLSDMTSGYYSRNFVTAKRVF